MKIKDNISKILGVTIIIGFCISSILLSLVAREFKDPEKKEFYAYTLFLENRFYDYRFLQTQQSAQIDKDIVLIKLDDESLQKIGTWPLPRTTWSSLIDKLSLYESKVIAFDIMFPENAPIQNNINPDDIFKESIIRFQSKENRKVILPYVTTEFETKSSYKDVPFELMNLMVESRQLTSEDLQQSYIDKYTFPIEKLIEANPDLAYINMVADNDGVFRHYKMVSNIQSMYLPSIALRAYKSLKEINPKLLIKENGSASIESEDTLIDLSSKAEAKIRWFGSYENFYNIPLWKVLEAKEDNKKLKNLFKDKLVFIGSTANGAHDLRNTPIDSILPGVFAHINVAHMLINNYTHKSAQESVNISLIILFICLPLMIFIMYFSNALFDIIALAVICASIYKIDIIFFTPYGYELKLAFVLIAIVMTYSWITFINFYKSNKEKKQIKTAFSRYVAPSIVNDMLSNPEKLKVGGERKDITCLFSDVRDFTSISEELSAADLAKCLNKYMGRMTDIVFENSGTLDKYIGDAIVAFWGAPLDLEDHASYALRASVQMLEVLPEINQEFKKEGFPEFKIGLGLNSGECNVGNMGSDSIFAYTALGDNMNLGARLESLCKHYGAQILISGKTYERINNEEFKCRKIDNVQVKGKEEGSLVYEVLYSYHPFYMDSYSFENFNSAYSLFEKREFKSAQKMISKVLESHPKDIPSMLLKVKIDAYIKTVPSIGTDHTLTRMTKK